MISSLVEIAIVAPERYYSQKGGKHLNATWPDILTYLMRGGTVGHYWVKQGTRSYWWNVDDPSRVPEGNLDIYFGVHPCSRIPSTNSSGVKKPPHFVRAQEEYIQVINCVFADFDLKDYKSTKAAAAHIRTIEMRPSIVIGSGGGFHCYWLLDEPFRLSSNLTREVAETLQAGWTAFVRADPAVSDLARILRVPGTRNQKYSKRPLVTTHYADLSLTYTIEELDNALPSRPAGATEAVAEPKPALAENEIREILDKALASKNGRKFGKLWNGDWAEDYDSQSEADIALCCHLAFWTQGDAQHIAQLFRRSALVRDKWSQDRYRQQTIKKALEQVSSYYVTPSSAFHRTDMGNAKRLVARYGDTIRYCLPWNTWLVWDGSRWKRDVLQRATSFAKATVLSIYDEIGQIAGGSDEAVAMRGEVAKWAARSEAGPRIREMVKLAESNPQVAVSPDVFDRDPWKLNVKNGVLDLKTGDLFKHNRDDLLTKLSPVEFDLDATCPNWEAFLRLVLDNDTELIKFLQRVIGYALTGSVEEEAFFILHGSGQNGKSTLINTIRGLLGDYSIALMPDTLMSAGRGGLSGSAREDLARLKGTRFAAASETEAGKRFAVALVKRMVSSEAVTARYLYGHTFEFKPTHKIFLGTNYKPQVSSQGNAIWRRLHLIPFDVYITNEQKVTDFYERFLEPELSGILSWALEGCLDWQEGGLQPPAVVQAAREEYKSEEDRVAEFLSERCTLNNHGLLKDLYSEYRDWCQESGYRPLGKKKLGAEIERRAGIEKHYGGKTETGMPQGYHRQVWFSGISLRGSMKQSLARLAPQAKQLETTRKGPDSPLHEMK